MTPTVFDDRACELGEGPLWHPERGQLFWFDILGRRLLTRAGEDTAEWAFPGHVSAAGWVDRDTLIVASETALHRFDIATGAVEDLCPLEADEPRTRSNDGRADPFGGFWIGTMAKDGAPGLGTIWRYYRGELRRLFAPIGVSNAICFAPDAGHAYFADSIDARVMRVRLGRDGWPEGAPETFLDLRDAGLVPDGAVTDAAGNLWLAQWDAARVVCHGPDGALRAEVPLPAQRTTCPAFGGPGFGTLFVTSARTGLSDDELRDRPTNGMTFAVEGMGPGIAEPRVVL